MSEEDGPTKINYVRSTYSEKDNCVEVGRSLGIETIFVRDSKDPDAPPLKFTLAEWRAFLAGAAEGQFSPEALTAH